MCLKLNNQNLYNHLIKADVIRPIILLASRESKRDSLLNSACLEFFEYMRKVKCLVFTNKIYIDHSLKENTKELIHHILSRYGMEISCLVQSSDTSTFKGLIRRWEINNEPLLERAKDDKYVPRFSIKFVLEICT